MNTQKQIEALETKLAEACRAFVDSEGGPEKFAEILKKGIF